MQTILNMLLGDYLDVEAMLLSHDIDHGALTATAVLCSHSLIFIVFLVVLSFILSIVVCSSVYKKSIQMGTESTR